MPEPAPVTTATLLFRSFMVDDLLLCDVLLTLTGVGPLDMAKARL
jgi:hypothetical protein